MINLFVLLFLISIICLVLGLVNPTVFNRVFKREVKRLEVLKFFSIAIIIFFILIGVSGTSTETKKKTIPSISDSTSTPISSNTPIPSATNTPTLIIRPTLKPTLKPVTPTLATKKLGVSYNQMMNYLSNFFTMEKSTPVKGEDRYMSTTSNKLATLEIIGKKDDISETSLLIGIPSDDNSVIIENSAILLRFLKNAVPEWEDSSDWATTSMEKIAASSNDKEEKIYGDKKINMSVMRELGMMIVTVKNNN